MTFTLLQCSWFSFLTFLNIQLKPRGWQTYIILSIVIFYSLLLGAGVETAVCSFFRTSANVIVVRNWKAVESPWKPILFSKIFRRTLLWSNNFKFKWGLTLLWSIYAPIIPSGIYPSTGMGPTQGQRKTLTRVGFEPTTFGLDHRCSTDWATRPEREQAVGMWDVISHIPTACCCFSLSLCGPHSSTRVDPWWNNWGINTSQ